MTTNKYLIFSGIVFTIACAICIALLLSLSSCDNVSKGRYKFQSESMHWLQFRGPNASGIGPENADPPIHFNADTNLLWKTEMLPGWSSPCIVNDKIFLTGFNDSDSLLYTIAIGRENGEILWKDSISPHIFYELHAINTFANPTVASDGEKVFVYFPNYGLIAYDVNGTRRWDVQHHETFGREEGTISPVVLDSLIILNINCHGDPRILALSSETGDTIWVVRHPEHLGASSGGNATPVIWNDNIIIHRWNEIIALNLLNGQPEWWLNTPTKGMGTPVI